MATREEVSGDRDGSCTPGDKNIQIIDPNDVTIW